MSPTPKHIVELARANRRNSTQSEFVVWQRLRNRRYKGHKFLRQHPLIYHWDGQDVRFFIADFYCNELKLVLEIDGGYHTEQPEQDRWRDEIVRELELTTLRIKNEDAGAVYDMLDAFLIN